MGDRQRLGRRRGPAALLLTAATLGVSATMTATSAQATVTPPPVNGRFDYQIGGSYTPADGVVIVDRDRQDKPAAGHYNVCYVNGFQVQPNELRWWQRHHSRLLLRKGGRLVVDAGWNEALLDTSTGAKRRALARVVDRWTDGCAHRGFRAVEFDNLDSFNRSRGRLYAADNLAFAKLIVRHAHRRGLAAGQKNTTELGSSGKRRAHFDFAIAEECQRYRECEDYLAVYGSRVIEIEYTDYARSVFDAACAARGSRISIVRRDRNVTPRGEPGYYYQSC